MVEGSKSTKAKVILLPLDEAFKPDVFNSKGIKKFKKSFEGFKSKLINKRLLSKRNLQII